MLRFFLLSSILALSCGSIRGAPHPNGRIVGGEAITIEDAPYQVSLLIDGAHDCGGSIITPKVILTAAHCVFLRNFTRISIQHSVTKLSPDRRPPTGSTNIIGAAGKTIYPKYNPFTFNGDLALIFLGSDIPSSNTSRPISLTKEAPSPGTPAVVTGYGRLSEGGSWPTALQRVTVPIIERTKCDKQYGEFGLITVNMLCAGVSEGGKDSCQGDTGGPLTVDGVQVGITSWGAGCGNPNLPGVYTNLAEVRPWIEDEIRRMEDQKLI